MSLRSELQALGFSPYGAERFEYVAELNGWSQDQTLDIARERLAAMRQAPGAVSPETPPTRGIPPKPPTPVASEETIFGLPITKFDALVRALAKKESKMAFTSKTDDEKVEIGEGIEAAIRFHERRAADESKSEAERDRAKEASTLLREQLDRLQKAGYKTRKYPAGDLSDAERAALDKSEPAASSDEQALLSRMGRPKAEEFKFGVTYDVEAARAYLAKKNGGR